jgi:hypothetical protein
MESLSSNPMAVASAHITQSSYTVTPDATRCRAAIEFLFVCVFTIRRSVKDER